jgi:hypothetical protein
MNAGTIFEMTHMSLSATVETFEREAPTRLPEQASDAAQDAVSISPASRGLLGARVQLDLEFTSIKVVQGLFTPGEEQPDPVGPLKRFSDIFRGAADAAGLGLPGEAVGVPDFLSKLREFFSPARTAQRIYDFATKHFGQGTFTGEDSEEMRSRYRDFVLPAIEQGFAEARATMGILPDEVTAEVDQTFSLIQGMFDKFVAGETTEEAVQPPPQEAA